MVESRAAGPDRGTAQGGRPGGLCPLWRRDDDALTAAGAVRNRAGITAALASGSHTRHPAHASQVRQRRGSGHRSRRCRQVRASRRVSRARQLPGHHRHVHGLTSVGEWSRHSSKVASRQATPVGRLSAAAPSDQTVQTKLLRACRLVAEQRLRPPVIFIVGEAAAAESSVSWFSTRPLFGQRIVVTRPEGQSCALRDQLQELGADVRIQPAIAIEPPADWSAVRRGHRASERVRLVGVHSSNGVRMWFERWWFTWRRLASAANTKLAAIGPGTTRRTRQVPSPCRSSA